MFIFGIGPSRVGIPIFDMYQTLTLRTLVKHLFNKIILILTLNKKNKERFQYIMD